MEKILFIYSTREGQTKKIFDYINNELVNIECDFIDLHAHATHDFDESLYDKIVIGASIRYGHFHKDLYQFINTHQTILQNKKSVFFCVNLTARKEDQAKDTPEGCAYIKTFYKKSQWKPDLIGVFAGALRYPRYRFFDRIMIRFIMSMTKGETDTSKEVEYTNWQKVSLFANQIKQL